MKASPRQQRLLLDLQALDNSLARLKKQRAALPQRAELAAMQGERSAAKDAFMALQRELDTQNADIERLESDIELVRQGIVGVAGVAYLVHDADALPAVRKHWLVNRNRL